MTETELCLKYRYYKSMSDKNPQCQVYNFTMCGTEYCWSILNIYWFYGYNQFMQSTVINQTLFALWNDSNPQLPTAAK